MSLSVNFGAQPQPQAQEKKSYALPAAVVGAGIGAGTASLTNLGKTAQYEDADTFVKTATEDDLKDVKDKASDVDTLKAAIQARKDRAEAADKDVKALYGDKTELPVGDVLPKVKDGKHTFEALKASLADDADKDIKADKAELDKIKAAAGKLENGKSEALKDGEKDLGITVAKDDKGVVTFTKKDGVATALEDQSKKIAAREALLAEQKEVAGILAITKDTKADGFNVSKENASKLFSKASDEVTEEAKTAFKNVQDLLPKKIHWGKFAGYTAGAGAIAGVLAYLVGGSSKN